MSETTAESAESLAAAASDTSAPPPTTGPAPAPTLAGAAEVRLARGAPEDEVVQGEDYKQKARVGREFTGEGRDLRRRRRVRP